MQTKKITVFGTVQNVSYRATCKRKAQELGLVGYVKNNRDGTVTIIVQGEEKPLQELISWAKKGPKDAQVQRMEITEHEQIKDTSFEINFHDTV